MRSIDSRGAKVGIHCFKRLLMFVIGSVFVVNLCVSSLNFTIHICCIFVSFFFFFFFFFATLIKQIKEF